MLAVASALLLAAPAPPAPTILSGPAEGSAQTRSSATFSFRVLGREDAYTYDCKVGSRLERFEPCVSPYTVTGLGTATHTFQVRATLNNETGLAATRSWTITAIDDDGDGHALPLDCDDTNPQLHIGAPDIPNNGVDEDCSGADATIVIPPIPLPAIPTVTPTPTPTPAAPKPKIAITLSYFMNARKRETRFSTLSVKGVPKGATVKVTCAGGCPRKSQTFKKSGTVALTGYRRRAIRTGATLTISVTKAGMTGMAKVITIRAGKRPTITTRTLSR